MLKHRYALTLLALGLPLSVAAQVPVVDYDSQAQGGA
ncbi:MAG TPA: tol-pal system protein YbgF, partial [Pseudomonas sp.]|nr:tol-pal system protein YbgF [Pseudomonas sp.]